MAIGLCLYAEILKQIAKFAPDIFAYVLMIKRTFEQYFNALYMPLGMYALRMVDDIDVAEDLVQDAFLKTWESLENGLVIENFKTWMYKCVRNECVAYLRLRQDFVNPADVPEVGEEIIDTSERDARIWRAIDELPQKCRDIFLMSKRDGLTGEEIAEELGISVKTVRNQITKAMCRLRTALADRYKPFFLPFL